MLIMFGPMIFRQISKMRRNSSQRQLSQGRGQQQPQYDNRRQQPRSNRQAPPEDIEYRDLNEELGRDPSQGRMSAEEKDFRLKEDEIMLSEDELKHYKSVNEQVDRTAQKGTGSNGQAAPDSEYDDFFES